MNYVSFKIRGEAILVDIQQDKIPNNFISCKTRPTDTPLYTSLGRPDNSGGWWYNLLHLLLLLLMILITVVVAGLRAVLTLGACLLSLVQWPTAMSAPTSSGGIPDTHPRLWVNPCGFTQQSGGDENSDLITEQISFNQMLNAIILQVQNAITSADEFKYNYVSRSCRFICVEVSIRHTFVPLVSETRGLRIYYVEV